MPVHAAFARKFPQARCSRRFCPVFGLQTCPSGLVRYVSSDNGSLAKGLIVKRRGQRMVLRAMVVAVAAGAASGQAGLLVVWGTTDPQLLDVPSGNFVTADVGSDFAIGVREDNSLAGWGRPQSLAVTNLPSGTFTNVSASLGYAVGIRTDGTLAAWGEPLFSSVLDVPPGTFVKVQTEEARCVGLRTDGTIATWGQTSEPVPTGQFIDVATGPFSGAAVRTDGTLVTWGLLASFPVPTGSFVAVEAGGSTTGYGMALRADGTVEFRGNPSYGNPSLITGAIQKIRANQFTTLALRLDGTLTTSTGEQLPFGAFSEINTTYGRSVAVIPAPAAVTALAVAWTAVGTRKRRQQKTNRF
jgi:hypothetical protein